MRDEHVRLVQWQCQSLREAGIVITFCRKVLFLHLLQCAPSSLSAVCARPLNSFGKIGSLLGFTSAAAAAPLTLLLPQPPLLPLLPQHPPAAGHSPAGAAATEPLLPPLLPQSHGRPLLGHTLLPLLPLTAPLLPPALSVAVAAAMPRAAAMASAVYADGSAFAKTLKASRIGR
jgi:hypothetical protein